MIPLPWLLTVFCGQVVQVESVFAVAVEKVLLGQREQGDFPVMFLYVPATQPAQGPPSAPVYPLLQVQSVMLSLSRGESELAVHCTQDVVALTSEYLPAVHPEQVSFWALLITEIVPLK